jgi:hypothetical protein
MKRVLLGVFAAGLVVAAIALLNQIRGGPATRGAAPSGPLTDVAAHQPQLPADPNERPEVRLARLKPSTQPVAPPIQPVAPVDMPDPARPPRWTEPLAEPPPPQPPDPLVPPPMVVDPNRGRTE